MILVIVDAHTKYIDAHVVPSASSEATISKLRQTFSTHGLPVQITSDNRSCFTSAEFADFCRMNGIKHICASPYCPASNGQAERAVQTVKSGLKKTAGWNLETCLYRFLAQYRMTPQTTKGQSPSELPFGRCLRTRFDLMLPNLENKVITQQAKMKAIRDSNVQTTTYYCGDAVWVMNMSGTPKWIPGVLEWRTVPVSFTVRLSDGRLWRKHTDHLHPCLPDDVLTPEGREALLDFRTPPEHPAVSQESLPKTISMSNTVPSVRRDTSESAVQFPAVVAPAPPSAPPKPTMCTTSTTATTNTPVPLRRSQRIPKPVDRLDI